MSTDHHDNPLDFQIVSLSDLGPCVPPKWIWPGYVARRIVTVLSGHPKAGKTTLLGHLLRDLYAGDGLVDVPIEGPTIIVSEEPEGLWTHRRDDLGLSSMIHLVRRQSFGRMDRLGWRRMIESLTETVRDRETALVVIDTLPSLWPVLNENDAGETLDALMQLRSITDAGAGLLLLMHTRKSDATELRGTRGSSAVGGFPDILIELRRDGEGTNRRSLTAIGRYPGTPDEAVIELQDDGFVHLGTRAAAREIDEAAVILKLLPSDGSGMTCEEIREAWTCGKPPGLRRLRGVLNHGATVGKWTVSGEGVRGKPRTYTLPTGPQDSIPFPSPLVHGIE